MSVALLQVEDLHVDFVTEGGTINAVRGVSFDILPGQTVALVGESGSGKSLTAQALLGLLNRDIYDVDGSKLLFEGRPLSFDRRQQPPGFQGRMTGYITQDPSAALDPTMTVGHQIAEMFTVHRGMSKRTARKEAARMLDFFLIEKVFYELEYELAYSPEWLRVPLDGALRLLGRIDEAAP